MKKFKVTLSNGEVVVFTTKPSAPVISTTGALEFEEYDSYLGKRVIKRAFGSGYWVMFEEIV